MRVRLLDVDGQATRRITENADDATCSGDVLAAERFRGRGPRRRSSRQARAAANFNLKNARTVAFDFPKILRLSTMEHLNRAAGC